MLDIDCVNLFVYLAMASMDVHALQNCYVMLLQLIQTERECFADSLN